MQDEKITGDIPNKLWAVYEKAFFSFTPEEKRRFTKSTEKQLSQLEQIGRAHV